MYELKTKAHGGDVDAFLAGIDDEQKRSDSLRLVQMMQEITGEEPRMWGDSIIGFGDYTYTYASGHGGNWFKVGFSPRKQNLSVYLMCGLDYATESLQGLGRYKTGKSCLYIKRLSDVDEGILRKLIVTSVDKLAEAFPH